MYWPFFLEHIFRNDCLQLDDGFPVLHLWQVCFFLEGAQNCLFKCRQQHFLIYYALIIALFCLSESFLHQLVVIRHDGQELGRQVGLDAMCILSISQSIATVLYKFHTIYQKGYHCKW